MKEKFKKSLYDGTLRNITFLLGVISLVTAFLLVAFFQSDKYAAWSAALSITLMLLGFVLQIVTYLLPSPRLHRPKKLLGQDTDSYIDQDPDALSSEQREALLQESWVVAAQRFLRIRHW